MWEERQVLATQTEDSVVLFAVETLRCGDVSIFIRELIITVSVSGK